MRRAAMAVLMLLAAAGARAQERPSYLLQTQSLAARSDWTGAWIGIFAGGGLFPIAQNSLTNTPASESAAMTGGAQVGYNYQVGNVVFGATLGAYALSNRRSGPTIELGGRLGYAIVPNVLVYASAGLATAQNRLFLELPGYFAPPARLELSRRQTTGFYVGAGIEYRLAANVSATGEYVYSDAGSIKFDGPFVFNGYADTFKGGQALRLQSLRFGLRYRF